MKKSLKLMFIFLLLFTMVSSIFLTSNEKISAVTPRTKEDETVVHETRKGLDVIGRIKVTHHGLVTIEYKFGFSELMVVATKCSDYYDAGGNHLSGDLSKAASCSTFNGEAKIIHMSGDYNRGSGLASKSLSLFNYYNAGEIIQVQMIFSFMESLDGSSNYSGLYYPLYCSVDNNTQNCDPSDTESKRDITSENRIEYFAGSELYGKTYTIEYYDRKYLVYQNQSAECSPTNQCTPEDRRSISNSYRSFEKSGTSPANTLYLQVENSNVDGSAGAINDIVSDTLIPVLMTILFVIAGVSIAILGYKIVKAADEPQERRENISKLRNILIGIAIALILLFAYQPLVDLISGLIEE